MTWGMFCLLYLLGICLCICSRASPKKQRLTPAQKISFQGSAKKVVPLKKLQAESPMSMYTFFFIFICMEPLFTIICGFSKEKPSKESRIPSDSEVSEGHVFE